MSAHRIEPCVQWLLKALNLPIGERAHGVIHRGLHRLDRFQGRLSQGSPAQSFRDAIPTLGIELNSGPKATSPPCWFAQPRKTHLDQADVEKLT